MPIATHLKPEKIPKMHELAGNHPKTSQKKTKILCSKKEKERMHPINIFHQV